MSIRITELDAITSLQSGDYIAVDNESTGTHKFDALNIGANIGQNIANTYSSSASYAIGQYCLYDNNLYKCITTISTPEAWNSSHWIQVTVGEGLYEKVDKISGKGLSTNDFTNAYKTKLDGIEDGAEVNVQANWTENDSSKDDYIKNKPENATTSISGFMSASDKQKLDGIEAGAEVNVQPNWAENDSSKDDYIKNKPTIDDALSTSSTNAVENSAIATAINNEATTRENADNALDGRIDTIEEILPNKANINGSYEEMTVGSAEQLISTESMEDSELYIFRKSGNGADIGDRETDMLVGGTVAWNQLAKASSTHTTNGVTLTKNSDGTVTLNGTADSGGVLSSHESVPTKQGHKYLIHQTSAVSIYCIMCDPTYIGTAPTIIEGKANANCACTARASQGTVFDNVKLDLMVIDLTAMFGTEIADYIYGLEQANAGDGVAWFRKYFPKPYYAYNAGSLQSVNVASHDMTGFNQWDEEWEVGRYDTTTGASVTSPSQIRCKNFIHVMPNTDYYIKGTSNTSLWIQYYDENKNIIYRATTDNNWESSSGYSLRYRNKVMSLNSECHYIKFYLETSYGTTYNHDICINISDVNRNGEYEEYIIHSYPYDESVELRGIPQFVNGELKYDGDTYESSGKVTRKYGIVDLGTLTWGYNVADLHAFSTNGIQLLVAGGNNAICSKYINLGSKCSASTVNANDKFYRINKDANGGAESGNFSAGALIIKDTTYSDAATFKTAMSGVYLVYELATPTEEEAEGFTNPQIVNASGTEEYVDAGVKNNTRDMAIPVGHITQYVVNLRDKLQHLPFLAKEDGDYFVNQTGTQMKLKKVEGYYEDLVVGVADNLSTDIRTNDQTPYLFRTSGGSVDIGDREYINSVVGGTIAWNQILTSVRSTATLNDIAYTKVDSATLRIQGTSTSASSDTIISAIARVPNHVYYKALGASGTDSYWLEDRGAGSGDGAIAKYTTSGNVPFRLSYVSGAVIDITVKPMLIDLTLALGSTIADYIYSLEQATAGAGVSYFRKLFPKPYYEYNAGELLSVSGLQSHDMVGFNQFDKSNPLSITAYINNGVISTTSASGRSIVYIPCLPNTTYCASRNAVQTNDRFYIGYTKELPASGVSVYDVHYAPSAQTIGNRMSIHTTTDADAKYVVVWAYWDNHPEALDSLCINISWDGSRDGEFEPYQKWSYPLDSSLELRGVPRLDSNNNLYYDGDTYESDGTVTRRYGVVDLGSPTWTYKTTSTNPYFATSLPTDFKIVNANAGNPNVFISNGYVRTNGTTIANNANTDKAYVCGSWEDGANTRIIRIADHSYTDATAFKTAMSGVMLVYELATPTTESAEPYTNPQIVDDFGTEEYVIDSTIDVPIPVGHNTDYPINLKSKLEMAPDSPDGDGDYIVRQTNGTNEYVPLIIEDQLPAVPSTDGTYTLTVTIANGEATYSWT